MKLIPLSQGKFAMVDDDAPAWIFDVRWHLMKCRHTDYACRNIKTKTGRTCQLLHVVIIGAPPGYHVHHKDRDGLNDLRSNLEVLTHAQHMRHTTLRDDSSCGFIGVSFDIEEAYAGRKPYIARVQHDKQRLYIGRFWTAEDAAVARDSRAWELGYPEDGMNFPMDPPMPDFQKL